MTEDIISLLKIWFSRHKRDLPWRKTYQAYPVMVSEYMLHQTRMKVALKHYSTWLQVFPSFANLAKAELNQVYFYWQGLGYYSRAKNLWLAAKIILKNYNSQLPADPVKLSALPGVGPYTAAALSSLVYNQPVLALDGNVQRLVARWLDIPATNGSKELKQACLNFFDPIWQNNSSRLINEALMDYASLVCVPAKPLCQTCCLQPYCLAGKNKTQLLRPVKIRKVYKRLNLVYLAFYLFSPQPRGRKLLWLRYPLVEHFSRQTVPQQTLKYYNWWKGLWGLPYMAGVIDCPSLTLSQKCLSDAVRNNWRFLFAQWDSIKSYGFVSGFAQHHITKYKVSLHLLKFEVSNHATANGQNQRWYQLEQAREELAQPSCLEKVASAL